MTTSEPVDYRHGRDIPDEVFLDAVRAVTKANGIWANRWEVACVLAGIPLTGRWPTGDLPGVPRKVVLSKARKLIKRGLLDGCDCGCRGDFTITEKGESR